MQLTRGSEDLQWDSNFITNVLWWKLLWKGLLNRQKEEDERERNRDGERLCRGHSFCGLRCLQQPGLDQAEAGSQGLGVGVEVFHVDG